MTQRAEQMRLETEAAAAKAAARADEILRFRNNLVEFRLTGVGFAIEAIAKLGGKEAVEAQQIAMKAARARARTVLRKDLAASTGTSVSTWKSRTEAFARVKKDGTANGKLWVGVKYPPGAKEHPNIAAQLLAANPSAFWAKMQSGHRGIFRRRGRKRLPIDELFLELPAALERLARAAARVAMRTVYLKILKQEYQQRISAAARGQSNIEQKAA